MRIFEQSLDAWFPGGFPPIDAKAVAVRVSGTIYRNPLLLTQTAPNKIDNIPE